MDLNRIVQEVVIDDSGAKQGADGVARAYDRIGQAAAGAEQATEKTASGFGRLTEALAKVSPAQESAFRSLQRLKGQADDVERGFQSLMRAEDGWNRAIKQGLATEQEKLRYLDLLWQKTMGAAEAQEAAAAKTVAANQAIAESVAAMGRVQIDYRKMLGVQEFPAIAADVRREYEAFWGGIIQKQDAAAAEAASQSQRAVRALLGVQEFHAVAPEAVREYESFWAKVIDAQEKAATEAAQLAARTTMAALQQAEAYAQTYQRTMAQRFGAQSGKSAEDSASVFMAGFAQQEAAAKSLVASYAPAIAATEKLARDEEALKEALRANIITVDAYEAAIQGLTAKKEMLGAVTQRAHGQAFRFGGAMQQVGWQVADVATQIAMGTNAMTAIGVQAGQLAGAMGPIGAAVGAVTTVVGVLAGAMLTAHGATDKAVKSTTAYERATEALKDTIPGSVSALDDLTKKYAALSAKMQQVEQISIVSAMRKNRDALAEQRDELQKAIDAMVKSNGGLANFDKLPAKAADPIYQQMAAVRAAIESFKKDGNFQDFAIGLNAAEGINQASNLGSALLGLADKAVAAAKKGDELDKAMRVLALTQKELAGTATEAEKRELGLALALGKSGGASRQSADDIIAALRDEQSAIGQTSREQAIATALRKLDATATPKQRAEVERLAAAIYDEKAARKALVDQLNAQNDAFVQDGKLTDALLDKQDKARQSIDDQIGGLKDEYAQLELNGRERAIHVELLKAEATARAGNITLTAEQKAAIEAETGALYDRKKAIDEATKLDEKERNDRVNAAKREAEAMQRPFLHAAEGIQDAFTGTFKDIFSGGVTSFKDLAGKAKDIFTTLAAEIATLMVFRPVVGGVMGAVGLGGMAAQMGMGGGFGGMFNAAGSAASLANLGGFGTSLYGVGQSIANSGFGAALGLSENVSGMALSMGAEYMPTALGTSFANGLAAAPWGIIGGLGASLLGLGTRNTAGAMLGGLAGSIGGGMAGSSLFGSLLGAAGGPVGAILGGFLGTSLFGSIGPKPSNEAAISIFDIESGRTSSTYAKGDANVAARDQLQQAIIAVAQGLKGASGAEGFGHTGVYLDVGSRDGTQFSYAGGSYKAADPQAALAQITRLLANDLTGLDDKLKAAIGKVDFSDASKAVTDIDFARRIVEFNKSIGSLGFGLAQVAEQARKAAEELKTQALADRERAEALGLEAEWRANATAQLRAQLSGKTYSDAEAALAQINAQFDVLKETAKELKLGVSAAEIEAGRAKAIQEFFAGLTQGIRDLKAEMTRGELSGLSAAKRLDLTQADLAAAVQAGLKGDQDAITKAAALVQQSLALAQQVYASGAGYGEVFRSVNAQLDQLLNMRGFASGTASAPPGMAWVGERGPELVRFAGGERVYPNGVFPAGNDNRAVVEELRELRRERRDGDGRVSGELAGLRAQNEQLRQEVASLREETAEMRAKLGRMRA